MPKIKWAALKDIEGLVEKLSIGQVSAYFYCRIMLRLVGPKLTCEKLEGKYVIKL